MTILAGIMSIIAVLLTKERRVSRTYAQLRRCEDQSVESEKTPVSDSKE